MIKKSLFGLAAFFLYLISLLPFALLFVLADLLFVMLFYVVRYRRKVVQTNLVNAFPEKSLDERKVIEKKYYRFLADMILESIKMQSISGTEIQRRFRLNNLNEITRHFENGKSVIVATGHYANWEWGTLIISLQITQPVIVIYKPLSDKKFEDMINNMRSRFGARLVSMKKTLRKIIEYKAELTLSVFVSDQTPTRHESQYFTTFLNQSTAVFLGIEKIAAMTNNPVLFCHINRLKRGYYEASFKTISEVPKSALEHEITEAHTRELEQIIRQRPELWLWSHRRWKFKPEDG